VAGSRTGGCAGRTIADGRTTTAAKGVVDADADAAMLDGATTAATAATVTAISDLRIRHVVAVLIVTLLRITASRITLHMSGSPP
jgi:hypothetical protein